MPDVDFPVDLYRIRRKSGKSVRPVGGRRLDMSGKSPPYRQHRRNSATILSASGFQFIRTCRHLTRRANHRHKSSIAKFPKRPRREKPAAGFFCSDGARHLHDASSPCERIVSRRVSSRAAVRSFYKIGRCPRTCRRGSLRSYRHSGSAFFLAAFAFSSSWFLRTASTYVC